MNTPRYGPLLLALLLFIATHVGVRHYVNSAGLDKVFWLNSINPDSLILQEKAFANHQYLPMYGSSEFNYLTVTYHPAHIFDPSNAGFRPFISAAAGNTCLIQVQNIASLDRFPVGKKEVIVLSMQWFHRGGIAEDAFGRWFSSLKAYEMVFNPSLPNELKQKIADRLLQFQTVKNDKLLSLTLESTKSPDRIQSFFIRLAGRCKMQFLREFDYLHAAETLWKARNQTLPEIDSTGFTAQDWERYHKDADITSAQKSTNNPYGMMNETYDKSFRQIAEKGAKEAKDKEDTKNASSLKKSPPAKMGSSWDTSTEYEDLRLLVSVLKALNSNALFVIQSGNGYWYDLIGPNRADRVAAYAKAHRIVANAGLKIADFSDHEYDKSFLVDASHPGWKGWCDMDEAIYKFYTDTME